MRWIRIGAVLCFVAVACGAFGAHALRDTLDDEMLAVWETSVQYHFFHGLALVLLGAVEPRLRPRRVRWAGVSFLVGVGVFSGSLYLLALTGVRTLGAITPIGGVAFLVGWILLALGRPHPVSRMDPGRAASDPEGASRSPSEGAREGRGRGPMSASRT